MLFFKKMVKIILTLVLTLNTNILKGQHLPCHHMWSDIFELLVFKPEFAAVVEFDILQEPQKAKTTKTDYGVLADSVRDLSQKDYFSFDEISPEAKLSTSLSIRVNYGKDGAVKKVSYLRVSFFSEISEVLGPDGLPDRKYIRLILNEEEVASLRLKKEADNAYWQFVVNTDTVYLESVKDKDKFLTTKVLDNSFIKGQTFYKYNTNEYAYFKTLVDSVILDEKPMQYASVLKKSFRGYCQKEIIYNEDKTIKAIFMLNQMRYALMEFETDEQKKLSLVSSKEISKGDWTVKSEDLMELKEVDSKGNWTKRTALHSLGSDWREIEYYED
jgi:hypothetical protein